jgi:2-keto-4-pentenoate hydratase
MSPQANRYAHQLLEVRATGQQIPPLSDQAALSLADAYDIAKNILDIRIAEGEVPVGRKLGFTNRAKWNQPGAADPITGPMWGMLFDTTVRYAVDNLGYQSLQGAVQPRLEPEIVFKLGKTPDADAGVQGIAEAIEWMAHGFEIVVSPFPDWKCKPADSIAAFAMHGALIVGEPKMLSAASRRNLAAVLASASVSLSCGRAGCFTLRGAGFGSDVLDSPVHALWQLHRLLQSQPQFAPLTAGEIITTGTWTEAYPIEPGQTWTSAFSGLSLPGLSVSFV